MTARRRPVLPVRQVRERLRTDPAGARTGHPPLPPPVPGGASVPAGLRVAADWSWRLVVVALAALVIGAVAVHLHALVVPLLVAVLLAAFVHPLTDVLHRAMGGTRAARTGAALTTVLLTVVCVGGLVTLTAQQLATGLPDLTDQALLGLDQLRVQLAGSPLQITNAEIDQAVAQLMDTARNNSATVVGSAVAATSTVVDLAAGAVLALFALFFFLADGRGIGSWLLRFVPGAARPGVEGAAGAAWGTLTSFTRATVLVAFTDALGIALVARLLGIPLVVPLGILVLLCAFVPLIGAVTSGAVAVLVALVAQGPVAALLMLAGVVAVQQMESHLLQPFLLGRAVRVHPLGVILSIGAGVILAGVVGALFAVPVVASVNSVVEYVLERRAAHHDEDGTDDAPDPGTGPGPHSDGTDPHGEDTQAPPPTPGNRAGSVAPED